MSLVEVAVSSYLESVSFPEVYGLNDAIQAACTVGFNALPHESLPQPFIDVPLLMKWYEIGRKAAVGVDHVRKNKCEFGFG